LIRNEWDLSKYLETHRPAYVQEYLPIGRDLRVVVLRGEVIHAYWRIQLRGEFRCNVARGAAISFDDIPEDGLAFARDVAHRCGFDEVGMDICHARGRYYILEANMVFGLEGFRQAGIDIHDHLERAAEAMSRQRLPVLWPR
jgi:ribosomal protein S6--L-glutamate ligase